MHVRTLVARSATLIVCALASPLSAAPDIAAARKSCEQGDAPACVAAASELRRGDDSESNRDAALSLFKKACDRQDAQGCFSLGLALKERERTHPSPWAEADKDPKALQKGCSEGDASDCYRLATLYSPNPDPLAPPSPVGVDVSKAASLYKRAASLSEKSCESGNALVCLHLGQQYHLGLGIPRDDTQALRALRSACSKEISSACALAGALYKAGPAKVVSHDAFDAAEKSLLSEACSAGFGRACEGLADRVGPSEAVPLLRQACTGHIASACTSLGFNYSLGKGLTQDEAQAVQFFEKGCNDGDRMGCGEAAHAHASGMPQDQARAAHFNQKGCDLGNAYACLDLGHSYLDGKGVPKDDSRAAQLYKQGCGLLPEGRRARQQECQ